MYQHIRTPVVGEKYSCIRNIDNAQDKHAIAIVNEERVVGHIPTFVSKFVNMFSDSTWFTFGSRIDRYKSQQRRKIQLKSSMQLLSREGYKIGQKESNYYSILKEHTAVAQKCLGNK